MNPELEQKIYEYKPLVYFCLGLLCLIFSRDSRLLLSSGLLFAAASGSVYYLRYCARNFR